MDSLNKSCDLWDELSRVVSQLLIKFPFYGHVLTSLARSMNTALPYAAAIGMGTRPMLIINPDRFFTETPEHRMGLLIHEIEHVIRLHLPRFKNRIQGNPFLKKKANIAMDLAINCTIQEEMLPSWVLFPRQFDFPDHQTAEWYYQHLPEILVTPIQFGNRKEKYTGPIYLNTPRRLIRDDFDNEELDKACGGNIPVELERQIIRDMVKQAAETTEKSKGNIPGHVREILKVFSQDTKIPWNILFRRICQWASLREKAYTKKRRSRRYGTQPGPYLKRRLKLAVAFDTSGSISDDELSWFFSELDHMARKGTLITLIQCDSEIQKVETYTRSFKRESPQVYGRGGTAFTPVFEYLLEEKSRIPDLLVFFTDGYGDHPKDPKLFPVCWIYTPNHRKAVDFGFHIEYETEKGE